MSQGIESVAGAGVPVPPLPPVPPAVQAEAMRAMMNQPSAEELGMLAEGEAAVEAARRAADAAERQGGTSWFGGFLEGFVTVGVTAGGLYLGAKAVQALRKPR